MSAISTTIAKITAINAKHGPFDACVLVGDTFKEGSDGSELDGLKCELLMSNESKLMAVPVPTYFTLGQYELPGSIQKRIEDTGGEVVENLVFLGGLNEVAGADK